MQGFATESNLFQVDMDIYMDNKNCEQIVKRSFLPICFRKRQIVSSLNVPFAENKIFVSFFTVHGNSMNGNINDNHASQVIFH